MIPLWNSKTILLANDLNPCISVSYTHLKKLEEEILRLEEQDRETHTSLEKYQEELEKIKAERELSAKDLSAVQLDASGLKQKDDFALENIRRVREEIRHFEDALNGLRCV